MGQNADALSPAPQGTNDSDASLLRQYVRHGSQAAFAALVRRYGGLVHATCLREVDDRQLAEDATQVVFLLLARKAPSLLRADSLAGWLFRASRFSARNALRHERRRKVHEQEVIADMTRAHFNGPPQPSWDSLEPVLNAALASLRPHEQEVILVRYLEGASWRETASRLGLAEDAAQKRSARAVDKMRRFVNRQGLLLSLAALTALLSEEAARAVPLPAAAVAKTVGTVTSGLPSPTVTSLYQGVVHTMNMTTIAATLGGIALTGTVSGLLWARPAHIPARLNPVRAAPLRNAVKTPQEKQVKETKTPQDLLVQVRAHYQGLSSFSMRVQHQNDSGLFPGTYAQDLQWRRGGRFVLRVTAQDNPNVSDFIADGSQVVYTLNGQRTAASLTVPPNEMPGWEVSGGEIVGWLQETPASHSLFSPPPGMTLIWGFGPRTIWHGMRVRELQAHISNQGHTGIMSLFLDPSATMLVGHEGEVAAGKPGYALFLDQKENPPLPATLGSAP